MLKFLKYLELLKLYDNLDSSTRLIASSFRIQPKIFPNDPDYRPGTVFVPKEEFDKYAPLEITPKPNTTIRVFMDFRGHDKSFDVVEPILITPERLGFTVVEWGGVLR